MKQNWPPPYSSFDNSGDNTVIVKDMADWTHPFELWPPEDDDPASIVGTPWVPGDEKEWEEWASQQEESPTYDYQWHVHEWIDPD